MVLPTPEISVVMPVWNAKLKKLIRANDSVLGQSFRDFEFIIVVDEPDECTSELLTDYVLKDKRVKVFSNPVRQGLVAALNKGIALSHGKYIARMDSDDQCCPGRLQKQYDFMESHPEVGISGTAFRLKDYRGHTWDGRYPVNDTASLCSRLMFSPCFGHPTVIFRSNFIKSIPGPYDPSFIYAEDYELWV